MNFAPINLEGFDGRQEALAGIKRYIHPITQIMFYRTNDLIHSQRVLWHLEEAIPNILNVYGNSFDVGFARTLALVHDDVEILIGDVQLCDKEHMRHDQLDEILTEENRAIPRIVRMYNPVANGHDYGELLTAAKSKDRLEAQFVSFFDKFDGAGEAWHEVFAGNTHFLLPSEGYVRRLNEFSAKYPTMAEFFKRFSMYLPEPFDFRSTVERGQLHTENSLLQDSGYAPYERWKQTIFSCEGSTLLVTQIEFY